METEVTNPYAPQAPAQQYAPPAQPQYAPPAAPQMDPQYAAFLAQQQAAQYAPPAPQYAPPVQQGYGPPATMGYQPPQPPPAPPLANVGLEDFMNQPSVGGGDSWKFPTLGTSHTGQVARELTQADFQQQTNDQGIGQTFRDGRPKVIMTVHLIDAETGQPVRWIVGGQRREALTEAMRKAGADPTKTPEAGAWIRVTYVRDKANGGTMGATHVMDVEYTRPNGSAPAPAAPVAQAAPPAQFPPAAPVQQPVQYAPAAPAPVPGVASAPAAPVPVGVPAPTAEQLAVLQSLGIPIPGQQ